MQKPQAGKPLTKAPFLGALAVPRTHPNEVGKRKMERSPGRTQAPLPEPSRAEQSRAETLGRVELKCAPRTALGHLLPQLLGPPGSGLTRSKNARPPPWSKKKIKSILIPHIYAPKVSLAP